MVADELLHRHRDKFHGTGAAMATYFSLYEEMCFCCAFSFLLYGRTRYTENECATGARHVRGYRSAFG